jgi:hypothetical protein
MSSPAFTACLTVAIVSGELLVPASEADEQAEMPNKGSSAREGAVIKGDRKNALMLSS